MYSCYIGAILYLGISAAVGTLDYRVHNDNHLMQICIIYSLATIDPLTDGRVLIIY